MLKQITYQFFIRLNLYLISLGVITSPVEISIFNGVITPSKFVLKNVPSYNSASKSVHLQISFLTDYESNPLIVLPLLSSKVIPPNMVLISFQHETWMHIS